jgi:hypothetical protein
LTASQQEHRARFKFASATLRRELWGILKAYEAKQLIRKATPLTRMKRVGGRNKPAVVAPVVPDRPDHHRELPYRVGNRGSLISTKRKQPVVASNTEKKTHSKKTQGAAVQR